MTTLPRPPADLAQRFTYHPPTPEQPPVYELLRDLAHQLALVVSIVAPDSPPRQRALEYAELVVSSANAAIARHGLPDAGTVPPTRILQAANDQLRESKPDSAVVSYCPAGWHAPIGHGTAPQPQAWQQASPYDDTRGPGWGDGEDVDTGRCCPWCAGDLSAHNRLVHDAGYSMALRHESPDDHAPQLHTGDRRRVTIDCRNLDSRGLLVLPGNPPPSAPLTAEPTSDEVTREAYAYAAEAEAAEHPDRYGPVTHAAHPEGVPSSEGRPPLLIIAVAEPATAEVIAGELEPTGVLFVPLGTRLHKFGPQL